MKDRSWLGADGLLLLTALIWGLAFSAQRMGMDHIGPMAYNALRFAIGTFCMAPFAYRAFRRERTDAAQARVPASGARPASTREKIVGSALAGLVIFTGSSLQQIGLVYTTAGNAGFITTLYVVIVPILGIFIGRKTGLKTWVSALIAVIGLYLLSVRDGFAVSPGDLFVLVSAFFWALHILIVDWYAARMDPSELGAGQYLVCAALSLASALAFEPSPFAGTRAAIIPVLYGGFLSIGVAFTLQIVAQKKAHPAHASIILSMESLFAALGGALILGEKIDARTGAGGALMFVAMVFSQIRFPGRKGDAKH